jgi:SAM-dependent methyltransferase
MRDLVARLRCPDDGAPLADAHCTACGRSFARLESGAWSLLPTAPPHPASRRERDRRDREAATYDRLPGLRLLTPWEVPALLRALGPPPPGSVVVELGCGTGRVTLPLLARGAAVVAVDHSAASLAVLAARTPVAARDRLLLVQADLARLPLAAGSCAAGCSAQALEHVPTPELRGAAVRELARVLAPGGRAALTAYRAWPWLAREGAHAGELYFRRFTRDELRDLLAAEFAVQSLSGRLGYVWLAALLKSPGPAPGAPRRS